MLFLKTSDLRALQRISNMNTCISRFIVFASSEMLKSVNMSVINVAQPRAEFGDTNVKSFYSGVAQIFWGTT